MKRCFAGVLGLIVALELAGAVACGAAARPQATPSFTGHVRDSTTMAPLEGADVELMEYDLAGDYNPVERVYTSASGEYELSYSLVPAFTYRIWFSKPGYDAEITSPIPGTASTPMVVNRTLDPDRGIYGRVLQSGGQSARDRRVRLYSYDAGAYELKWSGRTDATGDYACSLYAVPSGQYAVAVSRPGFSWSHTSVFSHSTPGTTEQNVQLPSERQPVQRLADGDRYTTAATIAREAFAGPGSPVSWPMVSHVVIASGEDRAAADPLAAAGLCGRYGAPLFLVSATKAPLEAKQAIKEIAADNGNVTVHIVGGPVSVPDARYAEIEAYVGGSGTLVKDRVLATGDRYDLAAAIAQRVGGSWGRRFLVANGSDPDKFFDALSLSPVSASMSIPILLVSGEDVPSATAAIIESADSPEVVVAGGSATVSPATYGRLSSLCGGRIERWAGPDRYRTALEIANQATDRGWLNKESVGVAAKLPDALTGGSAVGSVNGPLLITQGDTLTSSTGGWLSSNKNEIAKCYVFGGEKSVTPAVKSAIEAKLQ